MLKRLVRLKGVNEKLKASVDRNEDNRAVLEATLDVLARSMGHESVSVTSTSHQSKCPDLTNGPGSISCNPRTSGRKNSADWDVTI
jgi:hypothetical protein